MTEAWDLLMQGEFLQAVFMVYSYLTSEPFFLFMLIGAFSMVVWAATDSAVFAFIMFMVITSTLVMSHISQFSSVFGVIPSELQSYIALALVIVTGAAVFYAITKKGG